MINSVATNAASLMVSAKQEALRDKVKAVELEAEKLQQEALYAFTQSGPLGKPSRSSVRGARQCRGL